MPDKPQTPSDVAEFQLRFNGENGGQVRLASLIHALDIWEQVELVEVRLAKAAADLPRLQLVAPEGQVLTGYALFRRLVRSLRLLWPIALFTWLPGMARLGSQCFPITSSVAPKPAPVAEKTTERKENVQA